MIQTPASNASIFLQLDKGSYITGNQINGFVNLNAMTNIPNAQSIWISLSGVEYVHIVQRKSKQEPYTDSQGQRRMKTVYHYVPHTQKHTFFNQPFKIHDFNSPFIPAGQYSFPFTFPLGRELPSTFNTKFNEYNRPCSASVTYTVGADVRSGAGVVCESLKFSLPVILNQDLLQHSENKRMDQTKEINCFCCISQGYSKLITYFEKSNYAIGEEAFLIAEIDNIHCSARVQNIQGQLVQNLELKAGNFTLKKHIVIREVSIPGVDPGVTKMGDQAQRISLTLGAEDGSTQPSCSSVLVKNSYKLQATLLHDTTCACCDSPVNCSLDITLSNKEVQYQKWQQMPPGWNPQVFAPYTGELTLHMLPVLPPAPPKHPPRPPIIYGTEMTPLTAGGPQQKYRDKDQDSDSDCDGYFEGQSEDSG